MRGRLHRGWGLSLFALALVVGTWGDPAPALAEDYNAEPDAWNGVGYLLETAAEAKVIATARDTLDLSELGPSDVLFWLYPQDDAPTDELLRFVRDGGSLILADDFGASAGLLSAVGLARESRIPETHEAWFEDTDGFPILRTKDAPDPDHFLFFNVEEVIANHPASLLGAGVPLLSYGKGERHMVIERRVDQGVILAIADPSLFLNAMLRRFYGNKQFAANVMRFYCNAEPCRLTLLLPETTFTGVYAGQGGTVGDIARVVEEAVGSVNEAMEALSDAIAEPPLSLLTLLLLGVAALVLGLLSLAVWRRPARRPLLWAGLDAHSPAIQRAQALGEHHRDADFSGLAETLVTQAEGLEAEHQLEAIAEQRIPAPAWMTANASGHDLHAALLRVRRDAASLRSNQPAVVSAEQFGRLYTDVQLLAEYVTQRTIKVRREAHVTNG
ncbi:MAG: hypothetical protein ACI9MR_003466 [Myxococcota bacterium]